ncbi:MAG TPA: substrate-binding domain-containing protein [Gemmatimonadaceae bacterium]|nr:substrate-binding domain-containing protein [Gemmatimonadaceae bacterium]
MSSRSSWWLVIGGWWLGAAIPSQATRHAPRATPHALRVCADPNNLPFSNIKQEGFENALARLIARELGDTLEYFWWPQRRAWVRHSVGDGKCDVAMGVPTAFEPMTTTRPYYRSTYVFVSRADRHYEIHSLDDPRLKQLRIGLHFIGTDYSNPPPAHALGARGIVRNVVGYSIYGTFTDPNPPARLLDAVARGDVDVAIVWGPLAGYFASREPTPLALTPLDSPVDQRTGTVFEFPISVGVRRGDTQLRDAIQRVLDRRSSTVNAILAKFGVVRSGSGALATREAGR